MGSKKEKGKGLLSDLFVVVDIPYNRKKNYNKKDFKKDFHDLVKVVGGASLFNDIDNG